MKISVIICTFNRSESLRRALNSLRKVLIPKDLSCEFIVVDNNSHDDTRLVFDETNRHGDINLRYVFEARKGLSHARNRGISEARGEIIAFTDDDVIVHEDWIQNIDKAFNEHHDVVCIGGKILPVWEIQKPKWLIPDLYDYLALLDYGDSVFLMDSPNIWGANFAVRAAAFSKYGVFDTSRGRIPGKLYAGEEIEFFQRLQDAQEQILYYPFAVVFHCISANRVKKNYFRKWRFDEGEMAAKLSHNMKYYSFIDIHSPNFKKMLRTLIVSVVKIGCFSKKSFKHELRIFYILGYLSGRMKRKSLESKP